MLDGMTVTRTKVKEKNGNKVRLLLSRRTVGLDWLDWLDCQIYFGSVIAFNYIYNIEGSIRVDLTRGIFLG